MIAVDSNILVYARRAELPLHDLAYQALHRLAEGDAAWGIPIFCIGEFVRVVTHPRLFAPPTARPAAFAFIDALLASPSVRLLVPGERYYRIFQEVAEDMQASGNQVFDAQIAAVCIEHGARELLTNDRDYQRTNLIQPLSLEQIA